MRITILSVDTEQVKTARGGYQKASVAYKGEDGKVAGKNLVSFNNEDIFSIVKGLTNGNVVDVTSAKDDAGFWQWTSVVKAGAEAPVAQAATTTAPASTPASSYQAKSTYATKEERDLTQRYIVRQSSLANAISLLESNGGKKNTKEEVVEIAQFFEEFVFSGVFCIGDDGSIEAMKGDEGDVIQ